MRKLVAPTLTLVTSTATCPTYLLPPTTACSSRQHSARSRSRSSVRATAMSRAIGVAGSMPTVFISHGGGPMPLMGHSDHKDMIGHLKQLPSTLPKQPTAILVVSAHWEAEQVTVQTAQQPSMLFDYYNFPPETYKYSYPAPGAPELARRTVQLLEAAGIPTREDGDRGFDHGSFVPLMLMYPQANIPVFQVSLNSSMDPDLHIRMGAALAPLREEGVLILGSGMSYHNFAFTPSVAEVFDEYLREAIVGTAEGTRRQKLCDWSKAPQARDAHPREEHLMPLMVVAGAAGPEPGQRIFNAPLFKCICSDFRFG